MFAAVIDHNFALLVIFGIIGFFNGYGRSSVTTADFFSLFKGILPLVLFLIVLVRIVKHGEKFLEHMTWNSILFSVVMALCISLFYFVGLAAGSWLGRIGS